MRNTCRTNDGRSMHTHTRTLSRSCTRTQSRSCTAPCPKTHVRAAEPLGRAIVSMAALDSTADACPGRRRVAVTHLCEVHELFIGSDELEARGKDDRLRVLRGKRGQEAPEVGEHAGESYHMVRKAAAVACNCPSKATVGAQHTEGGEDLVHLPRWKEKERMHESSHLRRVAWGILR